MPAMQSFNDIYNRLAPDQQRYIQAQFQTKEQFETKFKALIKATYTKRADIIRYNNWNPHVINKLLFDAEGGQQRSRFKDFIEASYELQKSMFNFNEIPHPMHLPLEQLNNIYAGINACHPSHSGITVAKLMHAVVCYKDMTYGAGNWSWGVTAPVNPNTSHITDVSQVQSPLLPGNQIHPQTMEGLQINPPV